MGKVKSIFTMATLHLIKVLLNFSSRVLPIFIIAITLLKLAKVFQLDWRLVIASIVIEAILIIMTIAFYSLFFKKDSATQTASENNENNTNVIEQPKKLPILNISVAFFGFLGIIFIILKLFKAVTWSWVWVLSPLWLSTALTISILLICVIVSIVSAIIKKNKEKNLKLSSEEGTKESSNDIGTDIANTDINSEEKKENTENNN